MKEFPDAPLIRYRTVANTEVLVCNSLNSHKELLQTKCYSFRKPDWWLHTVGEMTGRGILSMEGEEHHAARRSLAGAFSLGNVRKLEPVVRTKAKDIGLVFDRAIAANKSGKCGIIDCTDTFSKLTLDIIGVSMLGIDLANITSTTFGGHGNDSGEKNRMTDGETEDYTFHHAYNENREFLFATNWISSTLIQIIRSRRRQVAEAMSAGKYVRSESCDVPTYLIEESMPGGLAEGITEKDFVGHLLQLMAAGHETSANVLSWGLYIMANRQDIQSKLRDEITALVAQVPEPTYTEIDRLQYLDHFIKESLRVFSSATTLHRKSIEDLTIEGIPIPKGALFDIAPSMTLLNPLIWGNDADEIKPSRWEHLTEEQSSPYAFEAFSNGPRICLGRLFAYMELKIILFEIIRNYRFLSVVKPFTVENPSLTLRPRGLEVRFEKVA
ncbi:hypothetical protein DL766_010305 [Monosporascus sp. MC13-8B]|uniref:Cytochrome P450 n=1 Tax=Monosporascus cannonballus TaxID=155416 RepID=A0ABY0GW50_9PEZI|nr:hypothetical protein DL762_008463 [Monosporascus cannonballus]RYO83891.1 hypothetical protein DL763_007663 [Monosporascus cannonballus]RYP02478.1 hypothetical protein DL766_010305 [Monosporascus sp. MC13-8B]